MDEIVRQPLVLALDGVDVLVGVDDGDRSRQRLELGLPLEPILVQLVKVLDVRVWDQVLFVPRTGLDPLVRHLRVSSAERQSWSDEFEGDI